MERGAKLDRKTALARKGLDVVLSQIFREEQLDPKSPGLLRAEELVREGYGLLNLITHFSRPDPVHAMRFLNKSGVLRQLKMVGPVARHQMLFGMRTTGRMVGVNLYPITTRNTVTRAQLADPSANLQLGEGQGTFNAAAVEVLKQGGIVVMAPQAERQSKLNPPVGRSVAAFVSNARRHGVEDFGVMFMGFEIPGEEDYGRLSGFNAGKRYTARIATLKLSEILQEVPLKELDLFAYQKLAECSPAAYRGFPINSSALATP